MKKKLAVMAIVLSAFCFTGFAQEVFNPTSSQYVAKGETEKEYTVVHIGQVKIDGVWQHRKERFVIMAESKSKAENKARDKFRNLYKGYSTQGVTVTCESTGNRCDYNF